MGAIGLGGGFGTTAIPQTPQEIEEQCIHVWRDGTQEGTTLYQSCIRCQKTRAVTL